MAGAMDEFNLKLVQQIPKLRRYARALRGDMASADDLVQDCMERAWSRSAMWRSNSNLRAWLFSIMHNLHVDQVRKQIRRPDELELDERIHSTANNEQELSQSVTELDRGLATLNQKQREVLLLVSLEGLSYEEVATVLSIPLGTVMSRLFRARERMRNWLDGENVPAIRRVK